MEIKDLYPLVLMIVFVGLLLGVGILVLDKFGEAAKDSTTIVNNTLAAVGAASVTLSHDDVTSVTSIVNASGDSNYRLTTDYNFTTAGVFTFARNISNNTVLVSYVYDRDTISTTSAANSAAAISDISTSWLSLIITIAILAIILGLVIRSFAIKR